MCDWTKRADAVESCFDLFIDMVCPWPQHDEGPDVVFDPEFPRARHIEMSSMERGRKFVSNLESQIWTPIINMGQEGIPMLLKLCAKLSTMVNTANEHERVADTYSEELEEIDRVCIALPTIACREHDRDFGHKADVAKLLDNPDSSLVHTINQNTYYQTMLLEYNKAAPTARKLRPKVQQAMTMLRRVVDTKEVMTFTVAAETCNLLCEAQLGLRPTQADELQHLLKAAVKQTEEHFWELMVDGSLDLVPHIDLENYVSKVEVVFGSNEVA